MKRHLATAVVAAYGCLAMFAGAQAADPAQTEPIQVIVQLGTDGGDLVITPSNLTFARGKLYNLVLKNPSDTEHRLSVVSFGSTVKTQAKPVIDRGAVTGGLNWKSRVPFGYLVREIAVEPGGTAEWSFVPYVEASAYIKCAVPGHAEAGMIGILNVI